MSPSLTTRLLDRWRTKAMLTLVLPLVWGIPYFALQRWEGRGAQTFPLSPVDEAIAFSPGWIWIYESLLLFLPIAPWLAVGGESLRRYVRGALFLCGAAFLVFALFPVDAPRPGELPTTGLYAFVVGFDRVGNAFPSLHVGWAVYTLLFALRRLRLRAPEGAAFALFSIPWVVAIAYSTLATKQHYFIDVVAGVGLAFVSHAWASWGLRVPAALPVTVPEGGP